jgi:hypothetical protein
MTYAFQNNHLKPQETTAQSTGKPQGLDEREKSNHPESGAPGQLPPKPRLA